MTVVPSVTPGTAAGFVHGFGMKRSAIACSFGHDSHNLCVVGVDDEAMAAAANRRIEIGGGFTVAEGGTVTAELALPVAGLMSEEPFETVRHDLRACVPRERRSAAGWPSPSCRSPS